MGEIGCGIRTWHSLRWLEIIPKLNKPKLFISYYPNGCLDLQCIFTKSGSCQSKCNFKHFRQNVFTQTVTAEIFFLPLMTFSTNCSFFTSDVKSVFVPYSQCSIMYGCDEKRGPTWRLTYVRTYLPTRFAPRYLGTSLASSMLRPQKCYIVTNILVKRVSI